MGLKVIEYYIMAIAVPDMNAGDHPCLDIIIVGAGLSGIAAAISCAQSGHHVTLLEPTKELGEV